MSTSLLITECMQNDFVLPIGRFDPLPNLLHVGFEEARRLMGEVPAEGPVARTMRWAHQQDTSELLVIHIRDWHDLDDPAQQGHLSQFGKHCVQHTSGAQFVFPISDPRPRNTTVVDSLSLNDFLHTDLDRMLAPLARQPRRVGLMGVWTEAKISFLAYELATRYPSFELAVCSALTASSSRAHHFDALDRLARLLGVRIIDSVGQFVDYLGGTTEAVPLVGLPEHHPVVSQQGLSLSETDQTLTRYLFRDCRSVHLEELSGGFSGNVVASAQSVDLHGRTQVPHVVKIGPRNLMGKERASFERVQEVLGNAAPHVSDFADWNGRGAIKYRYASMTGNVTTTFQKRYMSGAPMDEVRRVLDIVFGQQLARFYEAATLEHCDLLDHYAFSNKWAPSVRNKVEQLVGEQLAASTTLQIVPGRPVQNVALFYEQTLGRLSSRGGGRCFQATVHGDLNGANIVLDGHDNVWLIDFFHTRRAHVLMDLLKLENDVLFIYTPVGNQHDLEEATKLTDALSNVRDLAAPLPERAPSDLPALQRAWQTVRALRSFYPSLVETDRSSLQAWVGSLRYAVHTLSFDESNRWQRLWALHASGRYAEQITGELERFSHLRVDWVDERWTAPGKLGMTLLPGRRDYERDMERDLGALVEQHVGAVLSLVTTEELARYGVPDLHQRMRDAGMDVRHMPILDQQAADEAQVKEALAWVEGHIQGKTQVMVHCVGGLGRSGMIAACYLRTRGASYEQALAEVRRVRSPRAVETEVQERFVRSFGG